MATRSRFPAPIAGIDEATINFMLYRVEQSILRKIADECRLYVKDRHNTKEERREMKHIGILAAKMYNSYSHYKISEDFKP